MFFFYWNASKVIYLKCISLGRILCHCNQTLCWCDNASFRLMNAYFHRRWVPKHVFCCSCLCASLLPLAGHVKASLCLASGGSQEGHWITSRAQCCQPTRYHWFIAASTPPPRFGGRTVAESLAFLGGILRTKLMENQLFFGFFMCPKAMNFWEFFRLFQKILSS